MRSLATSSQQQLVVDQFSLAGGAFHVSVSPVVTSGSGGVHRLFEISGGKALLVDTQNQKGGVNVPSARPDATIPTVPPPGGEASSGFAPPPCAPAPFRLAGDDVPRPFWTRIRSPREHPQRPQATPRHCPTRLKTPPTGRTHNYFPL